MGRAHLYFYDAVSPVVEADSIDFAKAFRASRYGKGGDDYVNCPLTRAGVPGVLRGPDRGRERFRPRLRQGALLRGLPAGRGHRQPGARDPALRAHEAGGTAATRAPGARPFAVVQLRQDNLAASHYSVVGFQTQLKWSEQKRVFRLVPGLENAEFVRFGMIHRNTYVNAPSTLEPTFETRRRPGLFFAGQMSGVEGYVESAASGLVAGIGAARRALGNEPVAFPEDTALGALGRYIARSDPENYQPTNIAFGLLPELPARIKDKARKRMAMAHRALESLERFRQLPGGGDFRAARRAATSA